MLTQLGELKTYAFFTAGGVIAGTYAYGAGQSRRGRAADRGRESGSLVRGPTRA